MLERPPVELEEIDRLHPEPLAARSTAARTISAVIGPGVGHHLVKTAGRVPRASPPATAVEAPGDVLGAAVVVGHVEAVEAGPA